MSLKKFQIISIIITLFLSIYSVFAATDTTNINLNVTGVICNNNGICEPALGENSDNCPLDCPVPAPPGTVFIPDTTPPVIYNLSISEITLNSAEISWDTNEQALCQLFWGKTQEYKEEVISETAFYWKHSTKLTKLSPETTYHFKVSCRDTNRNESETTDQKFTTLTPPDITPPANIINFEAVPGDSQIVLTWRNPPDTDFKAVKIMRSTDFYPSDPWSGIQVYNGSGTSFTDTGLTNGLTYYYTAFTYDLAGNYSSGAIASATPFKGIPPPLPEEIATEEECIEAGFYWYDNACHRGPKLPPPPPEIEGLTLEDFDFWQEDKKLPLIDGKRIEAKTEIPLTISIDYEKVPEVLKTIMITLKRGEKIFSFLLRIDKEKIKYLATLMPPDAGDYPLAINVLDFKNQALKDIPGELITKEIEVITLKIPWYRQCKNWLYILIGLLILGAIAYFIRKLKKQNQKEKNKNRI